MNIILIGYMGSGKSTIGKKLSQILDFEYVDLDNYIEEKEKNTISGIFKTKGEIYFRKIEKKYLEEVLILPNSVISLGGGIPCYGDNMKLITEAEDSKSVYLKASIPQLVMRLKDEKNKRPLISHLKNEEQLVEFIGKHLFERSVFYNQSNVTLSVDNKSVNSIVEEVILQLF